MVDPLQENPLLFGRQQLFNVLGHDLQFFLRRQLLDDLPNQLAGLARLLRGHGLNLEKLVLLEGVVGLVVFVAVHNVLFAALELRRVRHVDVVFLDDMLFELVLPLLLQHGLVVDLQVRLQQVRVLLQLLHSRQLGADLACIEHQRVRLKEVFHFQNAPRHSFVLHPVDVVVGLLNEARQVSREHLLRLRRQQRLVSIVLFVFVVRVGRSAQLLLRLAFQPLPLQLDGLSNRWVHFSFSRGLKRAKLLLTSLLEGVQTF